MKLPEQKTILSKIVKINYDFQKTAENYLLLVKAFDSVDALHKKSSNCLLKKETFNVEMTLENAKSFSKELKILLTMYDEAEKNPFFDGVLSLEKKEEYVALRRDSSFLEKAILVNNRLRALQKDVTSLNAEIKEQNNTTKWTELGVYTKRYASVAQEIVTLQKEEAEATDNYPKELNAQLWKDFNIEFLPLTKKVCNAFHISQETLSQWFYKAVLGDGDAMTQVGKAYETGNGATQSNDKAVYWYNLAKKCGNTAAAEQEKALLARVAKEKRAEEIKRKQQEEENRQRAIKEEKERREREERARQLAIAQEEYRRHFAEERRKKGQFVGILLENLFLITMTILISIALSEDFIALSFIFGIASGGTLLGSLIVQGKKIFDKDDFSGWFVLRNILYFAAAALLTAIIGLIIAYWQIIIGVIIIIIILVAVFAKKD